MIVVDAGVLVDFLRTRDPKLDNLFRSQPIAVCGVTRAEILAGARDDKDHQRLLGFLGTFQQMALREPFWDAVGETLASLRRHGLTVPFPDAVIATIGIANRLDVWARDQHFQAMQTVLPGLQLFQEPP